MKSKKVLITGGLGFLGSYAVERWSKEGWEIFIIDNLSSNTILPDNKIVQNCKVIIKDVLEWDWKNDNNQYDLILHFASPVGPAGILKHSGKMGGTIIDDVYWAIHGAKLNNCPLIFVSTSEIYGYREEAVLLQEDDDKILVGDFKVRNEYSIAKLLGEIILSNTAKIDKNFQYQIIRPFNISGARQLPDGGFVLPRFMSQALSNQDITVFGNGKQVRAFTHVKDIIEGIYLTSITDKKNNIWNIGEKNNKTSINYLAHKVKEKTNSSSKIVYLDPKTIYGELYEEAWDKIPDASKIEKELNWKSSWTTEEIIDDVFEYYS